FLKNKKRPILKLVSIINYFLYFLFHVIDVNSLFGCVVNGEQCGTSNTRRNEINKNDLKQAYQMIISPDLSLLEQIENQLISKGGEK
ncbi:MAG: hypothetical protein Q8901_02425, partial [Candidatus Phytoplasma stylosanthis]|nr:hypothetical protein [Candidatus Phytoplasma stylosanthis]